MDLHFKNNSKFFQIFLKYEQKLKKPLNMHGFFLKFKYLLSMKKNNKQFIQQ